MTTDARSARRQGLMAGAVTFAVGVLPTVGILWSASTGSVGSVNGSGLGIVAAVVIGAIAVGSGSVVARAYERDPGRRPGDVWSTWYGGFVAFVLGTWVSPFLMLLIFVDSDRALDDQLLLALGTWTLLHVAAAGIALFLARGLLADPRPVGRRDSGIG